ncbi:MAG: hypothetical protein WDO19_32195 [Bacteroidota bacterium]
MKLKLLLAVAIPCVLFFQCRKGDHPFIDKNYPADVANAWMQMQIRLVGSTAGYNSIVSDRSFGYAGIAIFESIRPVIPGSSSLLAQIGGTALTPGKKPGSVLLARFAECSYGLYQPAIF